MAAERITVKSGRTDGRVALWERHPDHPNGEVFVATDTPIEVARTLDVEAALRAGDLVEVKGREAKDATPNPDPEKVPMSEQPNPATGAPALSGLTTAGDTK